MKKYFALYFILLCSITLVAQRPSERRFGTQQYMAKIQADHPGVITARSVEERWTEQFRQQGTLDTLTIPIVFHLINTPENQPVSEADVQAQLDRLNADFFTPKFRVQHPADTLEGFAERAAMPLIRFCLAEQDADGLPAASGIVRVNSNANGQDFSMLNDHVKHSEKEGSTAWDASKYCNIWVVAMPDGLAGYAQMPGGPMATDGIVVDERYFARAARVSAGDTITIGRTLVHLMGSYLNLYELWNEDFPCGDDYVEDTPIHNAPNGSMTRYRHVSLCGENPVEMTMNLMDATHEINQYMFTRGQVWRMQATLAKKGSRGQLGHTPTPCSTTVDIAMTKVGTQHEGTGNQELTLHVFPNPASGKFTIEIRSEQVTAAEIRIFDMLGVSLYEQSVELSGGGVRHEIITDRWSAGTYWVSVASNKQYLTQKVFVEK